MLEDWGLWRSYYYMWIVLVGTVLDPGFSIFLEFLSCVAHLKPYFKIQHQAVLAKRGSLQKLARQVEDYKK